jgi:thiamine pyrophosphate-dependent acetolactate synthase large subunit-like protein
LEQLADWLVASRRPVLIADQVGRNPAAIPSLLALAEALGAPVIDRGHRLNMPTTHPLDATGAPREALSEADLVLLLDVHDPFGALTTPEAPAPSEAFVQPVSAKLCQISLDELLVRSWTSDYQRQLPLDLLITADTAIALPLLVGLVRERLVHDSAARDHFSERGAEWADKNRARRRQWREEAATLGGRSPLALGYVASVLWEVIRDEDWALVNRALGAWPRRLWSFREPHQLLGGSGGEGLGYGMGAAMGAALAYRGTNRLAVNLQADGDLLFTPSAFWTAAHYELPMLVVVHNNRSLYNSEEHAMRVGRYRERPLENAGVGTQIRDPNVDFASLARTFGVHGEGPIETAAELRPALERALRVVKDQGRTAVVDVVCEPR